MNKFYQKKSPIIIIGMHRSGTSFLTNSLQKCGLFMGASRERNDESKFFLSLNNWLLKQSGGSWHFPDPFDKALESKSFRHLLKEHIVHRFNSIENLKYWGLNFPSNKDTKWGWKDPRNTFTLDFWLSLFPDARVISIRRHGIDVAASLCSRYQKNQDYYNSLGPFKKFLLNTKRSLYGYGDSPLSSDLYESFKLWEKYELKVEEHKKKYSILDLSYESFENDTYHQAQRIDDFLKLNKTEELFTLINSSFDKSRVNAWNKQSDLVNFYDKEEVTLKLNKLGY